MTTIPISAYHALAKRLSTKHEEPEKIRLDYTDTRTKEEKPPTRNPKKRQASKRTRAPEKPNIFIYICGMLDLQSVSGLAIVAHFNSGSHADPCSLGALRTCALTGLRAGCTAPTTGRRHLSEWWRAYVDQ